MSIFGSPLIQAPAGLNQAERSAARQAEKKKEARQSTRARDTDEVELQNSQTTDAVRGLTGGADEETAEDHHSKGDPQQRHQAAQDKARPRLDIKG